MGGRDIGPRRAIPVPGVGSGRFLQRERTTRSFAHTFAATWAHIPFETRSVESPVIDE